MKEGFPSGPGSSSAGAAGGTAGNEGRGGNHEGTTRPDRAATVALAAIVCAAVAVTASVGLASADDEHSLSAATKSATGRFHNLEAAKDSGYSLLRDAAGIACIDNQPVGGMGVHYANGDLVGNPAIDPLQPEALVYAPNAAGQLKLAALEYVVIQAAWDSTHASRPSLFGRPFDLTPFPNRFGLPGFYSLHAWVWQPNSDGLLEPWNPRVHC